MDSSQSFSADFFVATDSLDENPGTFERPFATLDQAKLAVNQKKRYVNRPISVIVRGGTYYLEQPLIFRAADTGATEAPITFIAYPGEHVTISEKKLDCRWKPYQDGIWMCDLPEVKEGKLDFTQLFICFCQLKNRPLSQRKTDHQQLWCKKPNHWYKPEKKAVFGNHG